MNNSSLRPMLSLLLSGTFLFLTIAAVQQPKPSWSDQTTFSQSNPNLTPTTARLITRVTGPSNFLPIRQKAQNAIDSANDIAGTSRRTADIPGVETRWNDSCVSHRMEISGTGIQETEASPLNSNSLWLDNPGEIEWLLAQVAGRYSDSSLAPDDVTFTTETPESITLSEPTQNSLYGYTFEAKLQPAAQLTATVSNVGDSYNTPRGFILYAKRDTPAQKWSAVGKTMNQFVYWPTTESHSEVLTLTELAEPTDLLVTAVVIDNNNDDRPLQLEAIAGQVLASVSETNSTHSDLLNIVTLTLPQVTTGTDRITVTLRSTPKTGDSLVWVGLNVSYRCAASPGLALTKTVDNPTPAENEPITYTVAVTNNGSQEINGVRVLDSLPAQLSYISHAANSGSYSATTGLWMIGDLPGEEKATLDIAARVNRCAGSVITNTAILTADQLDSVLEASVGVYPVEARYCLYLPIVFKDYEPCRFYDFSFENGDWINYEDIHTKSGYIDGEFQIRAKNSSRTHLAGPKGQYENYYIRAKIRWFDNSSIGEKYGLTFGVANDLSSFYTFMIYPNTKIYEIKYYNGSWNTLYTGTSLAITSGLAPNYLWIERLNSTISITINNTSVARNMNATHILGRRHVGVGVGPYTKTNNNHIAEARFDDYIICPLPGLDYQTDIIMLTDERITQVGSVPGG